MTDPVILLSRPIEEAAPDLAGLQSGKNGIQVLLRGPFFSGFFYPGCPPTMCHTAAGRNEVVGLFRPGKNLPCRVLKQEMNRLWNAYFVVPFGHSGDHHMAIFISVNSVAGLHDNLVWHNINPVFGMDMMYDIPGNILPGCSIYFKRAFPPHITALE